MPLWLKQYFKVGAREGCVNHIQKTRNTKNNGNEEDPKDKKSVYFRIDGTLLTKRKAPAFPHLLPAASVHSFLPPLSSFLLSSPLALLISLLFLLPSLQLTFSFPFHSLFLLCFLLSFLITLHPLERTEGTALSIGLRVGRAG